LQVIKPIHITGRAKTSGNCLIVFFTASNMMSVSFISFTQKIPEFEYHDDHTDKRGDATEANADQSYPLLQLWHVRRNRQQHGGT
jgi:hypothetical protein